MLGQEYLRNINWFETKEKRIRRGYNNVSFHDCKYFYWLREELIDMQLPDDVLFYGEAVLPMADPYNAYVDFYRSVFGNPPVGFLSQLESNHGNILCIGPPLITDPIDEIDLQMKAGDNAEFYAHFMKDLPLVCDGACEAYLTGSPFLPREVIYNTGKKFGIEIEVAAVMENPDFEVDLYHLKTLT